MTNLTPMIAVVALAAACVPACGGTAEQVLSGSGGTQQDGGGSAGDSSVGGAGGSAGWRLPRAGMRAQLRGRRRCDRQERLFDLQL